MAIEENGGGNGFYMPVAPAYNGGNNGGFGFGGDWGWIILLLLCANGGWGFGGMGGGMFPWMMMGGMGGFGMDYLYPWLNNSQHISDGFRDQMLNTSINGIQNAVTSGFGDVQTALCGGFAGVNATVNSGVNTLSQQLYNNTIADMNRSFALQSQLADCCCENRLAAADNKYTIATEACATRTADAQNTNALHTAITAASSPSRISFAPTRSRARTTSSPSSAPNLCSLADRRPRTFRPRLSRPVSAILRTRSSSTSSRRPVRLGSCRTLTAALPTPAATAA